MRLGNLNLRCLAVINLESRERPYIIDTLTGLIGSVNPVDYRDSDIIQGELEDMAQGRYPKAKVNGYTIFIRPAADIFGERLTSDQLNESLKAMADFFKEHFVDKKPFKYEKSLDGYYPGMPGTWHPLTPEELAEKKAEKARRRAERAEIAEID